MRSTKFSCEPVKRRTCSKRWKFFLRRIAVKTSRAWFRRSLSIFMLIAGGALVFLIAVPIGLIKFLQVRKMMGSPMTMPATTVSSVVAKEEDWAPRLTAVGSVSPVQGAVVSAELAGIVSEIEFQ